MIVLMGMQLYWYKYVEIQKKIYHKRTLELEIVQATRGENGRLLREDDEWAWVGVESTHDQQGCSKSSFKPESDLLPPVACRLFSNKCVQGPSPTCKADEELSFLSCPLYKQNDDKTPNYIESKINLKLKINENNIAGFR